MDVQILGISLGLFFLAILEIGVDIWYGNGLENTGLSCWVFLEE